MKQKSSQFQWLNVQAPRYTSYPSALYFKCLMPDQHQEWLRQFDTTKSVALYIHIPFCSQLCWFCGCHTSVVNNYSPIAAYVHALRKEIRFIGESLPGKVKLHSIHWGGGSPALLSTEDMTNLFMDIHAVFNVQEKAEIAIEFNPSQMTSEKINTYQHLGFNRVSLGIQDTDETIQKSMNRICSFEKVRQCVEMLNTKGIHAINMDLIYGLPFQTMQSLEKTITEVCELAPSRVAYYSFAYVPWLKKHQRLIVENELPDPQTKGEMYLNALKIFERQGYRPFGIDHFFKSEDEFLTALHQKTLRRNFMGYTIQPNDLVLGVGASAVSDLGQGLSQNKTIVSEYKNSIEKGISAVNRGWHYAKEDKLRKTIINELMCYLNVDLSSILAKFDYPETYFDVVLAKLSPLIETGVISITQRHIAFHSPLRMIVRLVCSFFDAYHSTEARCLKIA